MTAPWQVDHVLVNKNAAGVWVAGTNHYTGERFFWGIDWRSFTSPTFTARRWSFKGANFGPGARAALAAVFRNAKRLRVR